MRQSGRRQLPAWQETSRAPSRSAWERRRPLRERHYMECLQVMPTTGHQEHRAGSAICMGCQHVRKRVSERDSNPHGCDLRRCSPAPYRQADNRRSESCVCVRGARPTNWAWWRNCPDQVFCCWSCPPTAADRVTRWTTAVAVTGSRSANTSMTCSRTSRACSPAGGASMAGSVYRHGSKSASRIRSALVGLV